MAHAYQEVAVEVLAALKSPAPLMRATSLPPRPGSHYTPEESRALEWGLVYGMAHGRVSARFPDVAPDLLARVAMRSALLVWRAWALAPSPEPEPTTSPANSAPVPNLPSPETAPTLFAVA